MKWLKKHEHDWGLWRWQVEYISDQPKGFLNGRWIRYCKHCAGFQYDEEKTEASVEKYRQRYIKSHPYLTLPKSTRGGKKRIGI